MSVCLSHCAGATMLASSLKENKPMATSLSTLDLSGNMLGPDVQAALSFLAEPNAVATLKLARCSITFDLVSSLCLRMHADSTFCPSFASPPLLPLLSSLLLQLFPALCRGCSQSLLTLDVSENNKVVKYVC